MIIYCAWLTDSPHFLTFGLSGSLTTNIYPMDDLQECLKGLILWNQSSCRES